MPKIMSTTAFVLFEMILLAVLISIRQPNSKRTEALSKLANIAWQTLLFVSESLSFGEKVTPDLRWKQQSLASNVGQS